jgi:hypothetical protein
MTRSRDRLCDKTWLPKKPAGLIGYRNFWTSGKPGHTPVWGHTIGTWNTPAQVMPFP